MVRGLLVLVFVALAIAQAWDSGVLRSTPAIQMLVGVAIAIPAIAMLISPRTPVQVGSLALAAVGLFLARMLSPVPLGRDLFVILVVTAAITVAMRKSGPFAPKNA